MADQTHRTDAPIGHQQGPTGWDEAASDQTTVGRPEFVVRGGGPLAGQSLEIQPGTRLIGRPPDCDLCIDDGYVSRRHAFVTRDRNLVSIEDAGSANGTRVNGEQLREGDDPRSLQSGDIVQVGRIDLVYLDGLEPPTRRSALLEEPGVTPSVQPLARSPSQDTPLMQAAVRPAPKPTEQAGESPPLLSPGRLALDATATSVTSYLLAARDVDRFHTAVLAGAATLVTAFLQTRGPGQWRRVLVGAVLAFLLATGGITLSDVVFNHSPFNPNRPTTLLPAKWDPRPNPGIVADPPSPVACPPSPIGGATECPIKIESTGSASLVVTSITLTGPAAEEFTLDGADCTGRSLAPGANCTLGLSFRPTQAGSGAATLVVHQNLPKPDTGTVIFVTGTGLDQQATTTTTSTTGP
jgi:hypothetical protein